MVESKHREAFEILRGEILAGKFDDRKLPSENELARRFGCSRPTVSKAMAELKREGFIAARQGARAVVSRTGRNLTGSIGIVLPGLRYAEIFQPIAREIERLAGKAGYRVLPGEILGTDPRVCAREARRLAYQFAKERVAGVIFQPLEFLKDSARASEEILAYFVKKYIPVVLLDYDIVPSPARSSYDVVGVDNVNAGLAIGNHLLERGARRIAFLRRPGAALTEIDRMRGVMSAVAGAGLKWENARSLLECAPDRVRKVAAFLRRMKPDAIVCGNDIVAGALLETLHRLKVSVPTDLMLAGFDDVAAAAGFDPPLTTCHQPLEAIAHAALSTLLMRIRSPNLPVRTVSLPAPLVVRASTRR